MTILGNHIKMHLPHRLRERAREFYSSILGCREMPEKPMPNLDLYEFDGGTVVGLFYFEDTGLLNESAYLAATWLEIKTDDPQALKSRLEAFGVTEVDFFDKTRFYFQAPGGQVFRLAPMDGGL